VPPEKEWLAFQNREQSLLKPDHKPRDPATAEFPFSNHRLTKPLLEGTLARKTTMLKRRSTAYYVLTPTGFLLEYKDHDPVLHPEPVLSLKLADCELGNAPARSGKAGFTIRGKDAGKSFGGMSHEYIFRTDSMEQATRWWTGCEKFVGGASRNDKAGALTDSDGEAESPLRTKTQENVTAAPGQTAATRTATQTQMAPHTSGAAPMTAAPTTAQAAATHAAAGAAAAAPTAAPTTR
jgi:hypothetical protein